jgi:RimJ/RimL family protein N-acetyltransferase
MSRLLQEDGLDVLYMGGVQDPDSGLAEYKRGFGADVRRLEKVKCYLGSAHLRKLSTFVSLLKEDPQEIPRTLVGRVEHSAVFVKDLNELESPPTAEPGWEFRHLSLEEIKTLETRDDEFGKYGRRFRDREFSDAWGVFVDGTLAHINWLISEENDRSLPIRNVKLRPSESELTHGITLPQYRGRGLCPFAIASLLHIARDRGDSRVFSIAGIGNHASHRAIQKGGLRRCGDIYRWILDYLPGDPYLTFRGHRLGQCRPKQSHERR